MATAGDGDAPYESRGDGEKSRKRRFRRELNEEPQKASQEAGRYNSTGVSYQGANSASNSVIVGISELEQMLKQMTLTRSEVQRLKALLDSRTCDNVVDEGDATGLLITPMALPQQPSTIENLPVDLLLKIFIRLLAKQLAQMRCVSKSWNSLLSQPSFIKSHLHRSINNNGRVLLAFYKGYNKLFTAYSCRPPHRELTNFIKLPRVSPGSGHTYSRIEVIGSVHGLICFHYGDDVIDIWNPSLSPVSTLPPYSFPSCRCSEIFFRFGYDPKTEDYNVVQITGLRGPDNWHSISSEEEDAPDFLYVTEKWLQVEIYSMRKGCWKLITNKFPSHITKIFDKDTVCTDGHDGRLHWFGHTNAKFDSEMILAFDLGSETFLEMTLPDCILLNYKRSNTLGILGGKLCVMSRDGNGGIDVCVMEEYGSTESWVKRHVFCVSHDLFGSCTGFTSQSGFVYEDLNNCLVLYDPIEDKSNILEEYCPGRIGTDKIVEYVDSLVWVTLCVR